MGKITVERCEIEGLCVITPTVFKDDRGYFVETYNQNDFKEAGLDMVFVQDNHSYTIKKGTIRGIHFQNNPKPQIKLVRCVRGRVLDVVVDLRKDSPTYKKWLAVELSEENRKQIWIPEGYGHAFLTLEDNCEIQYKVSEFYYPEFDRAIAWDDEEINVNWNIDNPIVSEKDKNAPKLRDSDVNFVKESK